MGKEGAKERGEKCLQSTWNKIMITTNIGLTMMDLTYNMNMLTVHAYLLYFVLYFSLTCCLIISQTKRQIKLNSQKFLLLWPSFSFFPIWPWRHASPSWLTFLTSIITQIHMDCFLLSLRLSRCSSCKVAPYSR